VLLILEIAAITPCTLLPLILINKRWGITNVSRNLCQSTDSACFYCHYYYDTMTVCMILTKKKTVRVHSRITVVDPIVVGTVPMIMT